MKDEKPRVQRLETQAGDAAYNMALDEALLEEAIAGRRPAALRFYSWNPSAVTIGYAQDAALETDPEACRAAGVPVVRRITGGGAVFHNRELTYCVVIPVSAVPGSIGDSYSLICGAIASGLGFLKKGFEFSPVNDIIYRSKKVSGSAQVRRGGWLLQHGTVLLDADLERMFSFLRVPEDKLRRHGLESARQRVGCLREVMGREVAFEEAADAVRRGLETVFDIGGPPVEIEQHTAALARELECRYRSEAWNFHRERNVG